MSDIAEMSFNRKPMAYSAFDRQVGKWLDCERAAKALLEGADVDETLEQLRNNGLWSVVPWPREHLIEAVQKTMAGIQNHSASVPLLRHPALYALDTLTFAIAFVLGVKWPW